MRRISAIFIAVCVVLIAGSIGAVLYLGFNVDASTSAIVALTALTAMALFNSVNNRLRDRSDLGDQIADLSRGTADLARQVAEISRRLNAAEIKIASPAHRARAATDPFATEIGELGALVKQIAQTVASHAAALQKQGAIGARRNQSAEAEPRAPVERTLATSENDRAGSQRFRGLSRESIADLISKAVDANRIDLYLQPIVTLPQRKVRYYEAMSRLRTEDGDIVPAGDFIDVAESVGLMPKIDNLAVFRCVQVMRRLLTEKPRCRPVLQRQRRDPDRRADVPAIPRFHGRQSRARVLADVRIHAGGLSRLRPDRARKPCCARRARLPLLDGSCHRSAYGAERAGRPVIPLPESAGQAAAQQG